LLKEFTESVENQRLDTEKRLERLRISSQRVSGEADAVTALFKLLEKQKYARR